MAGIPVRNTMLWKDPSFLYGSRELYNYLQVKGISREDVAAYVEKWVQPGGAILGVLGETSFHSTLRSLKK